MVRVDPGDQQARDAKADALRRIGYTTPNSNWRNFYLTAARELDGTIDYSKRLDLDAPDQIAAMRATAMLEGLGVRIDSARCADAEDTIGVKVTDTGEQIGLAVRRGALEALGAIPEEASLS